MKNFLNVFTFEINNYIKSKSYILTTAIISLILIIGISLPSFINLSGLIPQLATEQTKEDPAAADDSNEKNDSYVIYDKNNLINIDYLNTFLINTDLTIVDNEDEIKNLVEANEVEGGFVVNSLTDYTYFVHNKGIFDEVQTLFTEALQNMYKEKSINDKGLNFEEINEIYNTPVNANVTVLGKDSSQNYFYAYILIFILYFMIIMYGQLVSTSVTSEKSSRAMEVLVTSTTTNSLIFGKVIAATIAAFLQVGVMLAAGVITYKLNGAAWNGLLDNFLAIPSNLLVSFAFFGSIGYLFYAFIYAALGALVSKTEDIAKSAGTINFVFIIAFFIGMSGLMNADSMLVKVASYVPFTSCMSMITRVALGSVSTIELIISGTILVLSTMIIGVLASKIYRLGTLRYGNPIKLTNAIKLLRKERSVIKENSK